MEGIQKTEWEGNVDETIYQGYVGWGHILKGPKSQAEKVKFNMIQLELRNTGRIVNRGQKKSKILTKVNGDLVGMDFSHIVIGIIQAQNKENTIWLFFLNQIMSYGLKESDNLKENKELDDWPDVGNYKRMFPSTIFFPF